MPTNNKQALTHVVGDTSPRKKYWYALATYVGTIIGVGIFGLPYVASRSGFWIFVLLLFVTSGLAIAMSLFYGIVASRTAGYHRLPGYAQIYLGKYGKIFAFMVKILSMYGSLLALLIIGGQFLANIFSGSFYLYTFLFFLLAALLIWRDQRSVGPVELILLFVFMVVVLFLFVVGVGHIATENLNSANPAYFFIPYGVLIFALGGTSIIPEVKEMVDGNLSQLKKIIVIGVSIAAIVYLVFALLVVGIAGSKTAEDGVSSLQGTLGMWVLNVGYFFGIITTFTSFITLGLTVKKIFWYDYHFPKTVAWLMACFVPLVFFIVGLRNFIDIIGLTGAIMIGLNGIVITMLFLKLRKKERFQSNSKVVFLAFIVMALLILGVVLEVVYSITGY